MKITNPIIEEIHAFRAEYALQYGNDLRAICDAARQKQSQSGHEIVSFFDPTQPIKLKREMRDKARQA